jgi:molybdenum-dependent DNA-binding transcriptional regulator ModE
MNCEPPSDGLGAEELALRIIPLRAIFDLGVLARCNGRLLRAARLIGISGAALSTQMTRMEAALGADVIKAAAADRRTFELTDYGESLVAALRAAMPALETLSYSLQEGAKSSDPENRRRAARRADNKRQTVAPAQHSAS